MKMELAKVYDELYGMIEDLKKQIGSGGGGGGIVINPEGAATADLEKIKKGTDIYGLNYNKNANRPQINGNLLTGNKNSKQLNIAEEMSEAAYAALSSKNENEIYFLTENAPIFTETDTVAASGITWSAGTDPDTYEATLSYSVTDTDTTGVVGVTCDNELITIGDPTYEAGAVSVPMICEDPTAITGDIEFVFTLEQPAGGKKIVHNGEEFATENFSTNDIVIGKWVDGSPIYRSTVALKNVATSTSEHTVKENALPAGAVLVRATGIMKVTDSGNLRNVPVGDYGSNYKFAFYCSARDLVAVNSWGSTSVVASSDLNIILDYIIPE